MKKNGVMFIMAVLLILCGCTKETKSPLKVEIPAGFIELTDIGEGIPRIFTIEKVSANSYRCGIMTNYVRKAQNIGYIRAYYVDNSLTVDIHTDIDMWDQDFDRKTCISFYLFDLPAGEYDVKINVDGNSQIFTPAHISI